ncbi:MAG: hypothetical protein AAGA96_10375 [Verrucomicrobiota bacterium]
MASLLSPRSKLWNNLLIDGESTAIPWTESPSLRSTLFCLATIFGGVGIYGASIGLWQGALMATYVGIKLPFIILLTLLLNGLFNGIIAQLLGSKLSFVQTTFAILTAFAVFALIVASLTPITVVMTLDAPAPDSAEGPVTHRRLILTHTFIIAFAGIISTSRLHRLLFRFTESTGAATRCLIALIVGNLFAGAQVGYLLRPIFCQPGLPVEFLRSDPFRGNFYEAVWWALQNSL